MKLEHITLQNFRQYFGKQHVHFAKDKDQNVTVLHGANGAGKTSFFLAINWCLYGRSVEDIKVVDNVGELMSKEAVHQAQPGEQVEARVVLVFTHNGERYRVGRSISGTKQLDGSFKVTNDDDFVMMITRSDGQSKRISNPLGTMNAILPANVREYFLFDGEKIDNFAKPEASSQVKQAIFLVLNIEILERGQRHLEHLAREYRKELKQASSDEVRAFVEKEEKAREARKKAEKRKGEIAQEIKSAEEKIAEIDVRLNDIRDAKVLQQRRITVEEALRQQRRELEQLIKNIAELVTGNVVPLAMPAIEKALAVLDEKRARGEIPTGIRQQFIQDLLEEMMCVCGRPITSNSPEHQKLRSLLELGMSSAIEDDVLNLHATLRLLPEAVNEKAAFTREAMTRHTTVIDLIRDAEAELDDLGRQLENSPLEEISSLEKRRKEYSVDIVDYNMEIGSLSNQMDTLTEEIKELEKTIGELNKQQQKQLLLSKKLELAQQSADAISEMYQIFADDMRHRIEAKTKEVFQKLVWKESHFQDIRLGPDYNLEVIDRYGQLARPELSAGERQVLSLSFIAAMSQISEEEAPLIMDTPFGRLSSQHRNSITQRLPLLASQLVLFVTDEELRDEADANLRPHIGYEYRLNFNKDTSWTKIEKI